MSCQVGCHPFPFRLEILGSGADAQKLRQRVGCALGGLGFYTEIPIHSDNERALALGATRDPVLLINDSLFIDGLLTTEDIARKIHRLPN